MVRGGCGGELLELPEYVLSVHLFGSAEHRITEAAYSVEHTGSALNPNSSVKDSTSSR